MSGCSPERAAHFLEACKWKREIAGENDFALAVKAVQELSRDRTKGLLLIGNVGVGKTHLADAIYNHLAGNKIKIHCGDDSNVDFLVPFSDANANGGSYCSTADQVYDHHVYLDDLGSEIIRNSYGTILDRCGKFLTRYYEHGKGRLIITTNLDGNALIAKYGARVFDRLVDKCVVVKFAGTSKRSRTVLKEG